MPTACFPEGPSPPFTEKEAEIAGRVSKQSQRDMRYIKFSKHLVLFPLLLLDLNVGII